MNTYGTHFRVTTYGESHGLAVGAIIDGCPAGIRLDLEAIDRDLARRRTGAPRQEEDRVEWLSGLRDGVTLGTPITFSIANRNTRPEDYEALRHAFRPGHADYTYHTKYGLRDHRGGGRASARETAARVVAGAIAKQVLHHVEFHAKVDQLGPDLEGDTRSGIVSCRITGLPAGVGEPLFGKLNARLAAAMMSIPSAIGFEMGAGFAAAMMTGSEYIDRWSQTSKQSSNQTIKQSSNQTIKQSSNQAIKQSSNQTIEQSSNQAITQTNHCGGVQGGISNGMPVEFRVAFHPVATLPQPVECLTADGRLETLTVSGRHDRCHIMRLPVIVEAMAALTIVNFEF